MSETYERKRKSVFLKEVSDEEEKLWQAARKGYVEEVQSLLSSIFLDVTCVRGIYSATPLCEAAYNGHKEVVKVLLDKGADPNWADKYGGKPIRSRGRPSCRKDIIQLLKLKIGETQNPGTQYLGKSKSGNSKSGKVKI